MYQITVMCIFVFAGDKFLPEFRDSFDDKIFFDNKNPYIAIGERWKAKYSDSTLRFVVQGRLDDINGYDELYRPVKKAYDVPSRHFTYIFNVFVMMQLFNFLNARKIQ